MAAATHSPATADEPDRLLKAGRAGMRQVANREGGLLAAVLMRYHTARASRNDHEVHRGLAARPVQAEVARLTSYRVSCLVLPPISTLTASPTPTIAWAPTPLPGALKSKKPAMSSTRNTGKWVVPMPGFHGGDLR